MKRKFTYRLWLKSHIRKPFRSAKPPGTEARDGGWWRRRKHLRSFSARPAGQFEKGRYEGQEYRKNNAARTRTAPIPYSVHSEEKGANWIPICRFHTICNGGG